MPRAKTPGNGNGRSKRAATAPQAELATEVNGTSSAIDVEAEIRRRAFELYEQRGRTEGHQDEDWFVAEREVLARAAHHSA